MINFQEKMRIENEAKVYLQKLKNTNDFLIRQEILRGITDLEVARVMIRLLLK